MSQDFSKLEGLAKAATPGPWIIDGEYVNEHGYVMHAYVASASGGRIGEAFANCLVRTDEQCRINAAFIAEANPATVLALLAENNKTACRLEVSEDTLKVVRACLKTAEAELDKLKDDLLKFQPVSA